MKRLMDVLGSAFAILVFSPVITAIGIMVKLSSQGPIIFKQKRVGQYGEEFCIYKFRTMVENAEEILRSDQRLYAQYITNSFKLDLARDPRVTNIGRFLRKYSLDELPQLFNVLKGEMSLVGPRPIVPSETVHYGEKLKDLLSVKPGITGYWQVTGRNEICYPERVEIELFYVKNQRTWLDLAIFFRTFSNLVARK